MSEQRLNNINPPKEKFVFTNGTQLHDQKFETKPVGYFKDAFRRFCKNKGSVVGAIIIGILIIFAIIGPFFVDEGFEASYQTSRHLSNYKYLRPKLSFMDGTGVLDGTTVMEMSEARYIKYLNMETETGLPAVVKVLDMEEFTDAFGKTSKLYKVKIDTYRGNSAFTMTVTAEQYKDIQDWQDKNGVQVILPRIRTQSALQDLGKTMVEIAQMKNKVSMVSTELNTWYACDKQGMPVLDKNGNLQPAYFTATESRDDYESTTRLASDPGKDNPASSERYSYAMRSKAGSGEGYNYTIRVSSYNYFIYTYGYEPSFIFGTDVKGYDIFSRLANGARFSFLLAITISAINLTIGAIYGAIEGYYGGATDMIMERISDILNGIPFTVVTILFQLHLAGKVGVVPSLLFAFVMTGWIGMASRVRMQFYRFKNQEYILAARTLGAKDFRLMFKHIFPNSLGTIITGSVLVIPGVIFSETSLTYLNIVNLDSTTMSSVGSMLSTGQAAMLAGYPHALVFPALFISLLMISFNLFGNGLRDAFNPSLRGAEG